MMVSIHGEDSVQFTIRQLLLYNIKSNFYLTEEIQLKSGIFHINLFLAQILRLPLKTEITVYSRTKSSSEKKPPNTTNRYRML